MTLRSENGFDFTKSELQEAGKGRRRRAQLTFLPPEDVRSGFMDSAFSLLDDLDRLLFSFSTDSGESQVGLVLLPFLEESGEKRCAFKF